MHRSSGHLPRPGRAWWTSVWTSVWTSGRTSLLLPLGSAVLLSGAALGNAPGAAVVALGTVGSVALVAAAWAALGAVLVQLLVTGLPPGGVLRREWTANSGTIVRAQGPGRPGRPRPRAPGAPPLPCAVR